MVIRKKFAIAKFDCNIHHGSLQRKKKNEVRKFQFLLDLGQLLQQPLVPSIKKLLIQWIQQCITSKKIIWIVQFIQEFTCHAIKILKRTDCNTNASYLLLSYIVQNELSNISFWNSRNLIWVSTYLWWI